VLVTSSGRRRGRAAARAFSVATQDVADGEAVPTTNPADLSVRAPDPGAAPVTTRGET
jgi:hypothetical protein